MSQNDFNTTALVVIGGPLFIFAVTLLIGAILYSRPWEDAEVEYDNHNTILRKENNALRKENLVLKKLVARLSLNDDEGA